jgi:hypothetical protein
MPLVFSVWTTLTQVDGTNPQAVCPTALSQPDESAFLASRIDPLDFVS